MTAASRRAWTRPSYACIRPAWRRLPALRGHAGQLTQCALASVEPGPVKAALRIEGVADSGPLAELEAHVGAWLADRRAVAFQLLRRQPVFACQVLGCGFALGLHLRVELEGPEMQLDVD